MFGLVTGKIKDIAIAALAVLLPVLYLIGRRDQNKINRGQILEDALDTEKDRADFYREMEKHNHEIEEQRPDSRADIIKRLRDHGF